MTQPQLALLRAGGEIRLSTTDGSLAPPLADAVRQAAPGRGCGRGGFGPGRPPAEFFWPSGMPTLGDVCEALHRATGLEVIADSFIRDRLDAAKVVGRHPLAQILDTSAEGLQYDWKKEG